MDSLEKQLQKCEPDKVKLIVIDGVFSMEGDVAKLPEIVALAKKYNASVMVDEAHGIGVFGDHGRGTCNHFGVTNDVDLIMGTFSKFFRFYRWFYRIGRTGYQLLTSPLPFLYL